MCSSNPIRTAIQPIAQITGADFVARKTLGTSVTDTLAPKNDFKSPSVSARSPYKGLAIGTQVGGTRKPLGSSSSGLNR